MQNCTICTIVFLLNDFFYLEEKKLYVLEKNQNKQKYYSNSYTYLFVIENRERGKQKQKQKKWNMKKWIERTTKIIGKVNWREPKYIYISYILKIEIKM